MLFSLLPSTLTFLLPYFFNFPQPPSEPSLVFHLRHSHALNANSSRIILHNFTPQTSSASPRYDDENQPLFLSDAAAPTTTRYDGIRTRALKPRYQPFQPSRIARARLHANLDNESWLGHDRPGPNIESRETLLQLARMTSNAYTTPDAKDWYPLSNSSEFPFPDNSSHPFGWEPSDDGFRGHIFVSEDNSTVIVSVKGTSAGWLVGGGGPTVKKDLLNDNLLFSCCCARVGPTWSTVCGCYEGGGKCDVECLEDALRDDSLFYGVGINLYNNVTFMYPNANIWFTGHSLGGSLASLIGTTFGLPVVTFEAPGERMAARRLHLPTYPNMDHIIHVRNNADSIAMGTCTGVTSVCALGGYALESKCHLGKTILYDTVGQLGWSAGTSAHGIKVVIDDILSKPWDGAGEGREVPLPKEEEDCENLQARDSSRAHTEIDVLHTEVSAHGQITIAPFVLAPPSVRHPSIPCP